MRRVVLGTAGHIDHGKTALVQALTGVDCDRIPEEKERGITIELGFASMQREDLQISFIDVPGHERFVRNMLAGAGGIDGVILVVAADESVMPQTVEHVDICRLLGIRHAVVALTKVDLVDDDIAAIAELEVRDLVEETFDEPVPVVRVSVKEGTGIEGLESEVVNLAARAAEKRASRAEHLQFRLPIDRVFVMKGFGTVVTGTTVGGRLHRDENVVVLPAGRQGRVRALQVHHEDRPSVEDGERSSVNLGDLGAEEVERGEVLAPPGVFRPTRLITGRLETVSGEEIRDGERLHLHLLSAETSGRVRLVATDAEKITDGEPRWVQIHLENPIVAISGDRFVVRSWSPMRTIGGGIVADPLLRPLKKKTRPAAMEAYATSDLRTRLEWMARESRLSGVTTSDLIARTGFTRELLEEELTPPPESIVKVTRDVWLHHDAIRGFRRAAMELLSSWFEENEISTGMPKGELVQKLLPADVRSEVRDYLLEDLAAEGIAEIRGKVVDVPGRDSRPAGEMGATADRIESIYEKSRLAPPSIAEVSDQVNQKRDVVQGVTKYLVETGSLRRLADGLYLHRSTIEEVESILSDHSGELVDVRWVKETFGLTRKIAIPLLEYLDGAGVTVRKGDQRRIL